MHKMFATPINLPREKSIFTGRSFNSKQQSPVDQPSKVSFLNYARNEKEEEEKEEKYKQSMKRKEANCM